MGDDGFDPGALRERIARQAETALMLANEL